MTVLPGAESLDRRRQQRGVGAEPVRAELVASSPAETTVSAVADRWGFGHAGRFAGAYRRRFGEYPAQTLARSRPR